MKMQRLTHFKIQNVKQLEEAFRDFQEEIDIKWEEFLNEYKSGKVYFQKHTFTTHLDSDVSKESKQIANPYNDLSENLILKNKSNIKQKNIMKKEDNFRDETPTRNTVEELHPEVKKEPRRDRIDSILNFIKLEVEPKKVTKLIQVIDLVNLDQGNVALDDILNLRD